LLELLEANNISDYQVIEKSTAKNRLGDPRFDTPVWPGYNSIILMQIIDDAKASKIMQAIRDSNVAAINDAEMVTACMWTLDDYCY